MKALSKKFLPFGLILAGIAVTALFFALKPTVSRARPEPKSTTVNALTVIAQERNAIVLSSGNVVPSQSVTLIPQVSGRVVSQAAALIPGGRFGAGQTILQIDPSDYKLALATQESQVRQAEVDLQLEQSRQVVAQAEWKLLGEQGSGQEATLALRKPQLAAAEEKLKAAQSGLERAKLDLARTTLRAPFNAMVVDENVDKGQVVSPSSVVATLIGTDRFWIEAAVPVDQLELTDIPGHNAQQGSPVEVVHDQGTGRSAVRHGRVVGLAGGLDPQTRTARVLIAVDNPLDPPEDESPLLNGSFVSVRIDGRAVPGTIAVPRAAVGEGAKVWVVDADGRLARRTVTIGWGDGETVVITTGLSDGDRVVTTTLAHPVVGMAVVIAPSQPEQPTDQ